MSMGYSKTHVLEPSLGKLRFRRQGSGFSRNGLAVTIDDPWLTFIAKLPVQNQPACDLLGQPGLWKRTERVSGRGGAQQQFHLPLSLFHEADAAMTACLDEAEIDPVQSCVDWAATSAHGEPPQQWTPPSRKLVETWGSQSDLTVQQGPFVLQGTLVYEAHRLALTIPVVHSVPAELSFPRRAWLEQVLLDAQDRWRMVRVGLASAADGTESIHAEVDLSGSPEWAAEHLFKIGSSALCCVVSSLIWPCGFLCDPGVPCAAWDMPPERAWCPAES